MNSLDANHFRRGDKVSVNFGRRWVPGRVIHPTIEKQVRIGDDLFALQGFTFADVIDEAEEYRSVRRVRVALSLPHAIEFSPGRITPAGTPILWSFDTDDVLLHEHDSEWNPYTVEPFATPDQYRVISGVPRSRKHGLTYPISHIGAYVSTRHFSPDDPVWVWEGRWIPAIVRFVPRSRVSVSYLKGYKNHKGDSAKSYPTSLVWAAICDYPSPIMQLSHP